MHLEATVRSLLPSEFAAPQARKLEGFQGNEYVLTWLRLELQNCVLFDIAIGELPAFNLVAADNLAECITDD
jgi:hypothetical protein